MDSLRLYKKEKLCSLTAIDTLFTRGKSSAITAFPLRAVWRISDRRGGGDAQFLITVPKKRLRHAVDRVASRRRIREAYRLNRHLLEIPEDMKIDIAFIYLDGTTSSYKKAENAVKKILQKISSALVSTISTGEKQ